MDRAKCGKFIQQLRREKNMTQQELAEKLGVTDKSVGNWENGRNMPDLSLLKPLCDILGITVNDLICGEIITEDKYQEKTEENIVSIYDYSVKQIDRYNKRVAILLLIIGPFIVMSELKIFSGENIWGAIHIAIGTVIFIIGISKLTNKMKLDKRIILVLALVLSFCLIFIVGDYFNVRNNNKAPLFRISERVIDENTTYYDALFYDVVECNNKYSIIKNKKNDDDALIEYCINNK